MRVHSVFVVLCSIVLQTVLAQLNPFLESYCQLIQQTKLPQATQDVERVKNLLYALRNNLTTVTPVQPGFQFFFSSPITDEADRTYTNTEILLQFEELLKNDFFPSGLPQGTDLTSQMNFLSACIKSFTSQFCVSNAAMSCAGRNLKYRSFDGTCVAAGKPKQGSKATAHGSLLRPNYDDGIQTIRKSVVNRQDLPSPRVLVNNIFGNRCNLSDDGLRPALNPNMGAVAFAAFVLNDFVQNPMVQAKEGGLGIECCTKDGTSVLPADQLHPACIPIKLPANDPDQAPRTCMNLVRTEPMISDDCNMSPRVPVNLQTSYIDLSHVYGTDEATARRLRTLSNGKLKLTLINQLSVSEYGEHLIADKRDLTLPQLQAFHVMYIREHNRVAKAIQSNHPTWDDETVYQETRRWVIAIFQFIIYNEYLGPSFSGKTQMVPGTDGTDARTLTEFSSSAFRVNHLRNPETLNYYDDAGTLLESTSFSDGFYNTDKARANFENVVRGIMYQPLLFNQCRKETLNKVFKAFNGLGIDLISLDIARGRDHGVQPYHEYLKLCHNVTVTSFNDFAQFMPAPVAGLLSQLYASPFDVDLFVAAALETPPAGKLAGPTNICIVNEQFFRAREGDPYYFDNPANPYPFTDAQLAEIRKASYGRIICDNTKLTKVTKPAFGWYYLQNLVGCDTVPVVNVLV